MVLGAGTIGLLCVAAARHLGAEHITVSARHPQQRQAAVGLGADDVIAVEAVGRYSPSPNVVIETVGANASTVADAVATIDYSGTVVIVGLFDDTPAFDPLLMMIKEVRIVSSMVYGSTDCVADFAIALEILADRGEQLRNLITHEFSLQDAQTAFETAADKTSGALKVMLEPR